MAARRGHYCTFFGFVLAKKVRTDPRARHHSPITERTAGQATIGLQDDRTSAPLDDKALLMRRRRGFKVEIDGDSFFRGDFNISGGLFEPAILA